MKDFRNATPTEIDTDLAKFYEQRETQVKIVNQPRFMKEANVRLAEYIEKNGSSYQRPISEEKIVEARKAAIAAQVIINVLTEIEIEPREEQYAFRGWTRAFFVQNAGGHIHTSRHCATCFPTTRFGWVTEDSGKDSEAIVEVWGESACTVCHPSAPTFARFSEPSRRSQEAQAERDAEKAAKADKKTAKRNASIAREAMSEAVEGIIDVNLRSLNADWGYDAVINAAEQNANTVIVSGAATMDELMKKARSKWNRDGYNKPSRNIGGERIYTNEEKTEWTIPMIPGHDFPGIRLDEN